MKKKRIWIGSIILLAVAMGVVVFVLVRHRHVQVQTTAAQSVSATTTTVPTTQATTAAVDVKSDFLILVNDRNPISETFQPDLITVEGEYQATVDKRIVKHLKKMLNDCRAAGFQPLVCSSYRSVEKQTELYNSKVRQYRVYSGMSDADANKEAKKWVAYPGTSEHHTGLALDIVDINNQLLDKSQEKTGTQQWLMQHCYRYGFILRYPSDKKAYTHINYEPWHYRYVGIAHAKKIVSSGMCLEEYLGKK